ncbi:helix-turn-helix transcriptional regulator [Streptomyces sp. NPDC055103]
MLPGDRSPLAHAPVSALPYAVRHSNEEASAPSAPAYQDRDGAHSRPRLLAGNWYSTTELAAHLRVDASTLRRWRTARPPQGPPFISVSERVVLYSATDVEEWLHRRRTTPDRKV